MADKFIRRFMDGRATPQQVHGAWAFKPGAHCLACSRRPVTSVRIFWPIDELVRRDPQFATLLQADPAMVMQMVVQMSDGKHYVRVSSALACPQHSSYLEKVAAKAPSWAVVDINRGPDPTNRVVVGAVR